MLQSTARLAMSAKEWTTGWEKPRQNSTRSQFLMCGSRLALTSLVSSLGGKGRVSYESSSQHSSGTRKTENILWCQTWQQPCKLHVSNILTVHYTTLNFIIATYYHLNFSSILHLDRKFYWRTWFSQDGRENGSQVAWSLYSWRET